MTATPQARRIVVEVTAEDIAHPKGRSRQSCCNNAVAWAIRRACRFLGDAPRVYAVHDCTHASVSYLKNGSRRTVVFGLPGDATKALSAINEYLPVSPFSFELEVLE